MANLTWSDTSNYIEEYYSKESTKPNRKLYEMLAAQALRIISERTHCYQKYWTNAGGGDLSIVGNYVALPSDCLSVERVEWDGTTYPLERMSESQLDRDYNGWRTATGEPYAYCTPDAHTLLLSTSPGTSVGKLVIRGRAYLPDFSVAEGAANPLSYIPLGSQLMVAYYVLSQLPVVPATPINDSREAIMAAQAETQMRMNNRADFRHQFEANIALVESSTNRKMRKTFSY